jgi:DNA-binding CsgD family transcriptional regulator
MTLCAPDPAAAPGYFDRAGAAICRIPGAHTEAEALSLLRDASRCIGADVAMFCSTIHDTPPQLRLMLACDPLWYLAFERGLSGARSPWVAPWIDYAAHCGDPLCGSQLRRATAAEVRAFEVVARHGFESMLIVPSPSVGTPAQISVLLLGSRIAGFFEDPGKSALRVMARSLSMELHAWRLAQARHELIQRAQLTATDIDLLRHERRGFRTKDIARHLRMTAPAIDSRFQRLNARLGVPSRKAAASLAATYGLV